MEAAYKLTSPDQDTDLNNLPQQMVTKYSHSQQERKAADSLLPRILIVSRRTLRKNKFVDFVGEYHLDLIVKYGAVPIIVPRVSGVQHMLHSFEPIHGVLLCEGEDVDPSLYDNDDDSDLSREELDEIQRLHSSDTAIDRTKDSIELQLTRRCLERNIPYLGICRGSQILNVACGGTLYQDVEKELCKKSGCAVKHINYDEYDGHRHPLRVVADTPLHLWFQDSFKEDNLDIMVNSYHHQGIKKLPERFKAMAYAPDGLVEAFYDTNAYNPEKGKFVMGLQFHPERMRCDQDQHDTEIVSESVFDYPGCPRVYQEFVKAVIAYWKITMLSCHEELEKKKKRIVRRFSVATLIDDDDANTHKSVDAQDNNSLHPASLLLKMNGRLSVRALDREEERRLKQIGATVRNSASYIKKAKMNEEKKEAALTIMESMSTQQLSDLLAFYEMMSDVGSEVLEEKLTSSTP